MTVSIPTILTALPHVHQALLARVYRGRRWWAESRRHWGADVRAWQERSAA